MRHSGPIVGMTIRYRVSWRQSTHRWQLKADTQEQWEWNVRKARITLFIFIAFGGVQIREVALPQTASSSCAEQPLKRLAKGLIEAGRFGVPERLG